MKLSHFDLRQMDDGWVDTLRARLRSALRQTLKDLKEARDRLNMTPANSSLPPSSMAPWESLATSQPQESGAQETPGTGVSVASAPDKMDPAPDGAQSDTTSPKHGIGKPSGKQLGALGHGRTQELPVRAICPHHPVVCAACGVALLQGAAVSRPK